MSHSSPASHSHSHSHLHSHSHSHSPATCSAGPRPRPQLQLRLRLQPQLLFLLLLLLSPLSVRAQDSTDPPSDTPTTGAPTTTDTPTTGPPSDTPAPTTDTPTTAAPTTVAPTTAAPTTAAPTTAAPTVSSTGPTGNATNTTVAPTATPAPTISNSTAGGLVFRNPNSTRAVCYDSAILDAYLSDNDTTPWPCPRPDVDGGVLGPRNNNFNPCANFTDYLVNHGLSSVGTNSTLDFYPELLCPSNTLASGLNTTATYKDDKRQPYHVPAQVTLNDPYPVMMVTSNALYNKKMLFMPKVDQFTQLEIAASHGHKFFSVPNTYISLEAGGMTTGPRVRDFRIPKIGENTGLDENTGIDSIKYNYYGQLNWAPTSSWRYGVVPFWTVLINADNGVINDIHFDEGCDACADQVCSSDKNCGVTEYACAVVPNTDVTVSQAVYPISAQSECAFRRAYTYFGQTAAVRANMTDPIHDCPVISPNSTTDTLAAKIADDKNHSPIISNYQANSTDCAIKIYVGWTGTDKNGKYFTSAGKRLSVFRRYSIGAAYNSAASFADNALPDAPTPPPAE